MKTMNVNVKTTLQNGFTLIELLLYISILGILFFAIVAFVMTAVSARIKAQSISEVDQQGAFAMEYVAQTIRNAASITAPAAGSGSASLTLAVPSSGLSPTVFDVSSGALRVAEGVAVAVPLTNPRVQISSLTFTNLSRSGTNGVVRVSFVVSRVNASGRNEYAYQKTFVTSVVLRQ